MAARTGLRGARLATSGLTQPMSGGTLDLGWSRTSRFLNSLVAWQTPRPSARITPKRRRRTSRTPTMDTVGFWRRGIGLDLWRYRQARDAKCSCHCRKRRSVLGCVTVTGRLTEEAASERLALVEELLECC